MGRFEINKGCSKAMDPKLPVKVNIDLKLTNEQYDKLKYGYCPDSMDDKWYIQLIDNYLSIGRSWTGHCHFKAHVKEIAVGYIITEVLVATDDSFSYQYNLSNIRSKIVNWLKWCDIDISIGE